MAVIPKKSFALCVVIVAAIFLVPGIVRAESDALLQARVELRAVLETRADLRSLFDFNSWVAKHDARTTGIVDLEDWARQYGYKEHGELWWYGTDAAKQGSSTADVPSAPRALAVRPTTSSPVCPVAGPDLSAVTADSILVLDFDSRRVMYEKNVDTVRPTASVAKLMTAMVALDAGLSLDRKVALTAADEVGGARLAVPAGTEFTVDDLLFSMLAGPANNAAEAVARTASSDGFVTAMNAKAQSLGLAGTTFTDPSGLDSGNVSTARDVAALLIEALELRDIRRITTTTRRTVSYSGGSFPVTNTNVLLTDPDNGLYVLGGKVGYLPSSGWNVAVKMKDAAGREKPLVIVLLGSESSDKLFDEAALVARRVWDSFEWRSGISVPSPQLSPQPEETQGSPLVVSSDGSLSQARNLLKGVYGKRGDLQSLFDSVSWLPARSDRTIGLDNLEDWAAKYGHREHDALWWYGTEQARRVLSGGAAALQSTPRSLVERSGGMAPVRTSAASFNPTSVTADAVFAIDAPTRKVLASVNADVLRPTASIAKLMTGVVAVDGGTAFATRVSLLRLDEIGGARLRVPVGATMTFEDMMYSMLVGSANNAAHAIARVSGAGSVSTFVDSMNAKAIEFGLSNTNFADPSGLDVSNVSTAREIAALVLEAMERFEVRKMCSTAEYTFEASTGEHTIRNTNGLLTDEDNGLYVFGGKTGYLHESKWNLVVQLQDARQKPVLVVVLGSDTKTQLFEDAERAARWAWDNHRWQ
ncbi:MAG: serine hydrolase [Patescibacteria group bacterium]|nr:serine hydrolase [Patescibacteria group bacterium]